MDTQAEENAVAAPSPRVAEIYRTAAFGFLVVRPGVSGWARESWHPTRGRALRVASRWNATLAEEAPPG